jgi:hypothetical protein
VSPSNVPTSEVRIDRSTSGRKGELRVTCFSHGCTNPLSRAGQGLHTPTPISQASCRSPDRGCRSAVFFLFCFFVTLPKTPTKAERPGPACHQIPHRRTQISGNIPNFLHPPEKTTSLMTLSRADLPSNGQTPGKNQTRFKGPWRPSFFKPNPAIFWQTGGVLGTYFHIPEPIGFTEVFRTGNR